MLTAALRGVRGITSTRRTVLAGGDTGEGGGSSRAGPDAVNLTCRITAGKKKKITHLRCMYLEKSRRFRACWKDGETHGMEKASKKKKKNYKSIYIKKKYIKID